jgi:hypothetical protein
MTCVKLRLVVALLGLVATAGCADVSASTATDETGNPVLDKDPYAVTCGDFIDYGGAPNIARRVAGDIDVPSMSRREKVDTIKVAIAMTCAQPNIPGVDDPRDYEPVGPVLSGVEHG